jgi:competence protein ComEA
MSFLDEVDSLQSKLHLKSVNPFMLIGIAVLLVALVAFALFSASSFLMFGSNQSSDNEIVISEDGEGEQTNDQQKASIFIHVGGSVAKPGLYELKEGSRVKDAIDAAGGLNEEANIDSINLAEIVSDGQQIIVSSTQASAEGTTSTGATQGASTGKVNINSATATELKTLDGVGDATAQKIIDYRQNQGRFSKPEDLKKVSGIGDKKYEAIKDKICV